MTSDRIKEIQQKTAYPNSVSVKQALLQVWNECAQERSLPTSIETLKNHLEANVGRICEQLLAQGKNPREDAESHKAFLMLAHLEAIEDYLKTPEL